MKTPRSSSASSLQPKASFRRADSFHLFGRSNSRREKPRRCASPVMMIIILLPFLVIAHHLTGVVAWVGPLHLSSPRGEGPSHPMSQLSGRIWSGPGRSWPRRPDTTTRLWRMRGSRAFAPIFSTARRSFPDYFFLPPIMTRLRMKSASSPALNNETSSSSSPISPSADMSDLIIGGNAPPMIIVPVNRTNLDEQNKEAEVMSTSLKSSSPLPSSGQHEIALAAAAAETTTSSTTTTASSSRKINYQWTRQNIGLAVPALMGLLADPLLSLMDTAYVGRLGSLELAALGTCTSIFHVAFNAFRATTAATTTLVASQLVLIRKDDNSTTVPTTSITAATDVDTISATPSVGLSSSTNPYPKPTAAAQHVARLSLQLGIAMGLVIAVGLWRMGPAALAAMGVTQGLSPLYPAAADYLFTRCWAAPVVLYLGVAEGVFRGYSDTVTPLVASVAAALINLVLDPLLMFTLGWGVKGAAAATALAQVGAAAVYAFQLIRRRMLPPTVGTSPPSHSKVAGSLTASEKRAVIGTIVNANVAMFLKQGSLLLGWAYATARATRLGPTQVAAHQVALSVWLVFALLLDGTAVSAQVLMNRAVVTFDGGKQVRSLIRYMFQFAIWQGLASMLIIEGMDLAVMELFTTDPAILANLHKVMPVLAWQQVLVSLTLVVESLAMGANRFQLLAVGTTISTVVAVWQLSRQTSIFGIWATGISTLFAGRLLTACWTCFQLYRKTTKHDLLTKTSALPSRA